MIITDYLRSKRDLTWDYAKQCGVGHGVIRLPEDPAFDICDLSHWQSVYKEFTDFGIKPIVVEPMPNALHDHIKAGDEKRDESIEKVIRMLPIMDRLDIRTICFNFMAHVGWYRTDYNIEERGGALVTGFDAAACQDSGMEITQEQLWENYTCFVKAVLPYAERYGIRLALHPDDPPVPRLGKVSRIMISHENIKKAIEIGNSDFLGITMCQACYQMMGEDLFSVIPEMKEKIFSSISEMQRAISTISMKPSMITATSEWERCSRCTKSAALTCRSGWTMSPRWQGKRKTPATRRWAGCMPSAI